MKRLVFLPIVLVLALPVGLGVALYFGRTAWAEPAFGGNCLGCHSEFYTGPIGILNADGLADPDESFTGAPDRGLRPVFRAFRGTAKPLQAEVIGLDIDDTYAVELRRLAFSGVVLGGTLNYSADCDWPEWGEQGRYYTEPIVGYRWDEGPTDFAYEINVQEDTAIDYYDLLFAVAGKFAVDNGLFYAREHFYLQVLRFGDFDADGDADAADFNVFLGCYTGPDTAAAAGCNLADVDGDTDVDLRDFATLQERFGT